MDERFQGLKSLLHHSLSLMSVSPMAFLWPSQKAPTVALISAGKSVRLIEFRVSRPRQMLTLERRAAFASSQRREQMEKKTAAFL